MAGSSGGKSGDIGLLILRAGIGAMFIGHGLPKLMGGPALWSQLGQSMSMFGVTYAPEFWGFMCAFAECVGGVALVLGLFVKAFAGLMFVTMAVATAWMLHAIPHALWFTKLGFNGGPLPPPATTFYPGWSHPAEMAIVFLALLIMGGGGLTVSITFPGKGGKGPKKPAE